MSRGKGRKRLSGHFLKNWNLKPKTRIGRLNNWSLKQTDTIARYKNRRNFKPQKDRSMKEPQFKTDRYKKSELEINRLYQSIHSEDQICFGRSNLHRKIESVSEDRSVGPFADHWKYVTNKETLKTSCKEPGRN